MSALSPHNLLPGPGNNIEFFHGNSIANAAVVASQRVNPLRSSAIHWPSGTRTPDVVPFQVKTTSRSFESIRDKWAAGHNRHQSSVRHRVLDASQYLFSSLIQSSPNAERRRLARRVVSTSPFRRLRCPMLEQCRPRSPQEFGEFALTAR